MVYKEELKKEVKERLKNESVLKLNKEYKISIVTLYKWKKEKTITEDENINETATKTNKENTKRNNKQKVDIIKLQREIKKLTKTGDVYEALKLANSISESNKQIDIQKASILYNIGTLKSLMEAKQLYEKYLDDKFLLTFYNKIIRAIEENKNGKKLNFSSKEVQEENIDLKLILTSLLTRLYCDDLTLEEINNSSINEYQKALLTIAYYEKHNKKVGINFIKAKKKEYLEEPDKMKTLNLLSERLKINKTIIFDISLYSKHLDCYIDSKEAVKIMKKKEVKETPITYDKPSIKHDKPTTVIQPQTLETEKEKKTVTIISQEGKRVNSRYQNTESTSNINRNTTSNKEILIKEVFKDEVLEIGMHLYIRMQNFDTRTMALKAWDNLEILINKPITDKYALEKIIYIIKTIERSSLLDIQYNENNIKKHLKKSK